MLQEHSTHPHCMERLQVRLTEETVDLAAGAQAVCVFVNDEVTELSLIHI